MASLGNSESTNYNKTQTTEGGAVSLFQYFRLVPFNASAKSTRDTAPALAVDISGILVSQDSSLSVSYQITAPSNTVKHTTPNPHPSRKNDLWRTTCFELFAKPFTGTEYWEYNLAPSGDWNAYRFTAYRSELQAEEQISDIAIETEIANSTLVGLKAVLPLPTALVGQKLAIGITCVIEDTAGNMHYFALHHPGAKPDFHDPAGFVLTFDPASA